MDYTLAIAATEGELEQVLDETLGRLVPLPTRIVIVDRTGDVDLALLPIPAVTGLETKLIRVKRGSKAETFRRLWTRVGAEPSPFALVMTDEMQLIRSLDVRDAAYVLEMQPGLHALGLRVGGDGVQPTSQTRRGSGGVAWFATDELETPALIRPALMRAFPWPRAGVRAWELGIRSSLPDGTFGVWGVGDAWAEPS